MAPMRRLAVGIVLAAASAWTVRSVRAEDRQLLVISGLSVVAEKPVCLVRLTNISPNAADIFSVHYTVRSTGSGVALSRPAAGIGAQLGPGKTLELNLGEVVAAYRRTFGVGPYTGPVQFIAYGEDGAFREFAPDTIHVSVEQTEGKVVRDAAIEWLTQPQ
jgi:hypothetical protein